MPKPTETMLYRARLTPHRSMTPRQSTFLVIATAIGCCVSSLPFFLMGAWPVIGFIGLDVFALWWAFRASFRAARVYEDVEIRPFELLLAKVDQRGRRLEWRFNPFWVRLEKQEHEEFGVERLSLVSHGKAIEFAKFLGPDEKAVVARDVADALVEARRGPHYS